jgi:hypothetical protein
MLIILAEIGRIMFHGQPGQTAYETPISKIASANELEAWLKQ